MSTTRRSIRQKSPLSSGNLQVADQPEKPVKRPVSQPLEDALLPAASNRIDDVVPAAPEPKQLGDQLRRVLQVAVHHEDGLTTGVFQPRRDRGLVAEIPAQVDHDDSFILCVQAVDHAGRRVATAIINEQHLEGRSQGFENGTQTIPERNDVLFFVE